MRLPRWSFGTAKEFLLALWNKGRDDNIADTAASLSFFGLLALFPFLIGMVTLASLLLDPGVVEALLDDLSAVAPPDVTRLVGNQLKGLIAAGSSSILTLSAFGAYWAASGGMSALMRALNRVNEVEESRPWWLTKAIALATTLVGVTFILIAAVVAVATPAVAKAVDGPLGNLISLARIPVAGLTAMFAWELLYHFLPDVKRPFRYMSPGAVIAVILWLAASWGFSVYVVNFGRYEVTYGALGAVVVLLVWMWISSLAVLLGMEINYLLEKRGDRVDRGDRPPAD